VTFLSTHLDERSANETISLFWQAYDQGRLKTPEDVTSFIKSIQTPVAPPPQNPPWPKPMELGAGENLFLPLAA
jgi:hypothetical protein